MWPYWLLFILPATPVLTSARLGAGIRRLGWALLGVVLIGVIGFRHEVGGDWHTYLEHLEQVSSLRFEEALAFSDPGYYGVNWIVGQLRGEIYAVNLVCALMVVSGAIVFSRAQPIAWLAMLVSVPYLLIVVGMGYTRQSAALGLAMVALVKLGERRTIWFVICVLVGALFHKTAVLLLPVAALAATQRRLWTWAWVGITSTLGAVLLIADASDAMWTIYVVSGYSSEGGVIRVAMNAVPAALLLMRGKRLGLSPEEMKLWSWLAVIALGCVPLVFLASTAVDRVALYLIPLQLFVFSRTHRLADSPGSRGAIVLGVVVYYAAVQWVWLNLAAHSQYWVPYRFMPL